MKQVIDIPENWEGCTNRHLRKCISKGTLLMEVLDDIKVEIGTVMATNMGIDGEEYFDKGCKMCLDIIDHQGEQGMIGSVTLTEKENEFLTQRQRMKVVIDINKDYFDAIKSADLETSSAIMLIVKDGKPLTEVLEDIKTDIEGLKHEHTDVSGYRWWDNAIDNALSIIVRHINGEGSTE